MTARLARLAFLATALLALAPATAPAQQEAGGILVVDWERAINESLAGRDILRQIAEIRQRVSGEVQRRRSALGVEEAEIASLRDELGAVEFEARARDFEEKVAKLRAFILAQEEAEERARQRALGTLEGEARQALVVVMRESGATHAFDRRLLLGYFTIEATELLIEQIDARVQRIAVEYEQPDLE